MAHVALSGVGSWRALWAHAEQQRQLRYGTRPVQAYHIAAVAFVSRSLRIGAIPLHVSPGRDYFFFATRPRLSTTLS